MKIKLLFHYLSYLQYPLMIFAIFYAIEPYFKGSVGSSDENNLVLDSLNNMMIFLGLGISFSSLQDTTKTSLKFEKKIWENPKKGMWVIALIILLSFSITAFGVFGYFITENEQIKEVSFGAIVFGVGFIGFLKTGIEVFNNHRIDKNTPTNIS
jgi:magnesium-transporting ATPase (P-type)